MDCPTCGARNDDRYRFCGTCGKKLQERTPIRGNRDPIDRDPPPETGPVFDPYRGPEPIDQEPPPDTVSGYGSYRAPGTLSPPDTELPGSSHPGYSLLLCSFRYHFHRLRCSSEWQSCIGRHRRSIANIPKRKEVGVDLLRRRVSDNRWVDNILHSRGHGFGWGRTRMICIQAFTRYS